MQTESVIEEVKLPDSLDELMEILNVADAPEMVIKLVGESETNWTKEGTDGPGQTPERLSMPSICRILPTSQVALNDPKTKYKLASIRYIAGCPSLDPKWQDDNGYVPDMTADNIWIDYGVRTFKREGGDAVLYDYIKLYQGNVSNPYRPSTAEDEFEVIIDRDEAEKENEDSEIKLQAFDLIRELRKPSGAGKGYDYDEERIQLFSTIFNLNSYPTHAEKFQQLTKLADNQPMTIINSIVNHKRGAYATVKQAMDLSVIALTDDKAYLVQSNTVILPFKTKYSTETQINKLVDFLITSSGDVFYKQIIIKVKEASELL